MSYSIDLRGRVIKFIEEGGSKTEAARIYAVCRDTIYDWLKKKTENGTLSDVPQKENGRK